MMSWCTKCLNFFVLHYFFCLFFFHIYFVSFSRLLLKYLLSAIHSQNQMTSCLFLLWMAQNIALYLFSFKLSLIRKGTTTFLAPSTGIAEIEKT